jgi:hypothetical protein
MHRVTGVLTAVALVALVAAAVGQTAPPADWDEAVIDACESAADFAPADEAAYADCKLTTTDAAKHEGRSVVWSFTAKEGAESVALAHAPGPLRGRGAIGLWLKNPGGCETSLRVRLIGADANVYESEAVPIGDARAWRQLVFATDDLKPDGDILFPLRSVEIALEGVQPGEACTLYLDDLTAYVAPPEELEVLAITAPASAERGGEIAAQARVRVGKALRRTYPLTVALMAEGVVIAEAEAPFEQRCTQWPAETEVESGPVNLRVPEFLAGGEYTLRLRAPGLALSGDAAMGVPVRIEGEAAEPISVYVAERDGAPTAMIGEEPVSLWGRFWWGTGSKGQPTGGAGTRLLVIPATAAHDPYGWAADVWPARDVWDYAALDRSVLEALGAQPDARLILRVFIEAPDWWDAENPQELILFSHGRHAAKIPGVTDRGTFAAFTSKKWREDAKEALRRFIAHVEQAPYADRVIGYVPAGGEDGCWRYWGAAEGLYADYSRPQRVAFVNWLRRKYNNDVRELRVKWQQIVNPMMAPPEGEEPIPTVLNWDDVHIPDIAARTDHLSQSLLDPAAAPEVADYNLFHAEQVADFVCELAGVAKEACERRKLVGVSYGHLLDHARSAEMLQTAGHIALDRVLTSDDIDLVAAPCMALDGHRLWSSLGASVKAHGKVPIDEILPTDTGADLGPEAAQMAVAGGAVWAAEAQPEPPEPAFHRDRASAAEIALLVDHFSAAFLAEGNALSSPLLAGQCASLAEVGAPCDVWLLDDLIAGRLPEYKLYVVANAFNLDESARESLREQLARDGKTVLWIYAPGAMDETLSGRTAMELTDLAIGFVAKTAPLWVKVVDSTNPLIEGVPKGFEYGTTDPAGPVFFALPTRGEVLGTIQVPSLLEKGEPREWAGLIASEGEDWTTVFSAAPNVPAELLRPIARHAGVHVYVDTGDEVWANASTLALHALSGGGKRIRLPQALDVRDVVSGERLATNSTEFRVTMREGETRLFALDAPK